MCSQAGARERGIRAYWIMIMIAKAIPFPFGFRPVITAIMANMCRNLLQTGVVRLRQSFITVIAGESEDM